MPLNEITNGPTNDIVPTKSAPANDIVPTKPQTDAHGIDFNSERVLATWATWRRRRLARAEQPDRNWHMRKKKDWMRAIDESK